MLTWQDLKSRTKTKAGHIKKHARGTGGGPPLEDKLATIEEEILDCVKIVSVEEHKKATESAVDFYFHFIEDPLTVPIKEMQFIIDLRVKVYQYLRKQSIKNVSLGGGLPVASTSGSQQPTKKNTIKKLLYWKELLLQKKKQII
ncbi:unnamed protein product [Brassicogethes aeneus]|uniref:Uncharacterized protein n=1 Tax=Brassicogethes aeneus TaxID=1431903 RepID=A0A9P0FQ27_BRAAE|nr:unnamed protein product [Brassicogethes aeneus]